MSESATIGALQIFKAFADNPLTRNLLKTFSTNCPRDENNRLEVALELYVGVRKKACLYCRLARSMLAPFLSGACRAFGTSERELKAKFKDPYWRRGLANVLKGIAWFGVRHPYVPGAPFQVVWNITTACNLKCVHCYESAAVKGADELSTEEALRGIDILADAGVLILAFSGGEPTMRSDILKLIKRSSERGLYAAIATNGVIFSSRDKVHEFKNAGLQFVQISLDGSTSDKHDSFRGIKGCFNKTVKGIKNCVAEGLFVEVATTVTRFNYKEIPDIIDLVKKLGVTWFMLYNFVPTGRGTDIIESDLSPDERENILKLCWRKMKEVPGFNVLSTAPQFARIAQEAEAQLACNIENATNSITIPTHFYNPKLSGQLRRLADFIGGCGAGRFYLCVEPNGDIYPCVFFPHEEVMRVGNLLQDDIEDIWRYSSLFWKIRDKDRLKENCRSCQYRYTCGGCRARAYTYFKDVLAPDPGCTRNKKFWERI